MRIQTSYVECSTLTDVGKVRSQLEAINHLGSGLAVALYTEGEDTTVCVSTEELLSEGVRVMGRETEIRDPGHAGVLLEPFGEGESVVAMPLGTQAECLQSLQEQEGAEGVERWSEVTEKLFEILI